MKNTGTMTIALMALLIVLVVPLSLPLVEACECRELNLTVDINMFAGDTKQIFFFPNCNYIIANVSASSLIETSEYSLKDCVEYSPNVWNCTCNKNFTLAISTKPNTVNKYLIKAQEVHSCKRVYYYCDKDKDGYRSSKPSGSCNSFNCVPKGCSLNKGTDCDDNNPKIYPGAKEICNGKDDDCDGRIDENACPRVYYYCDKDKDGYRSSSPSGSCKSFNCVPGGCSSNKGTDCDDNDKSVHPGAKEVCNGKDDDCDGEIDEGCGAEGFCNAITIRGPGDVAGFMRCLRADWQGNEPRKLVPNDCRFKRVGQGRSSSFICSATKQAN